MNNYFILFYLKDVYRFCICKVYLSIALHIRINNKVLYSQPRPIKPIAAPIKSAGSVKKTLLPSRTTKNNTKKCDNKFQDDLIKAHEVEVRLVFFKNCVKYVICLRNP